MEMLPISRSDLMPQLDRMRTDLENPVLNRLFVVMNAGVDSDLFHAESGFLLKKFNNNGPRSSSG